MTQHLGDPITDTLSETVLDAIGGGRGLVVLVVLGAVLTAVMLRARRERAARRERIAYLEARIDRLYGPLEGWRVEGRALRETGAGLPPDERRAWLRSTWLPHVERIAERLREHAAALEDDTDAEALHTYLGALRAHLATEGDEPTWPVATEAEWSRTLVDLRERVRRLRAGEPEITRVAGPNDLPGDPL